MIMKMKNRCMLEKRILLILLVLLSVSMSWGMEEGPNLPAYKDSRLAPAQRVADLLPRMTLEEKVGQTLCLLGWNCHARSGDKTRLTDEFYTDIDSLHCGMFWGVFRADPWTQKTLVTGLNPRLAAETANAMQRYAMEHTRLGIPLFFAEEAPHGHMAIGTTVFPTGLGMSATFDTCLMAKVGKAIASEIRLQGGHVSYGPVLDLVRDPRWSRVEETMGEDHVLTGEMGAALIRGMGGGHLELSDATLVTPKHFIAYGASEGGLNGSPASIGTRALHAYFLPPFRRAVEAGARSVMTAYNSVDGVPCTSNPYLLRDVLCGQWDFGGFVVSDLYSINTLSSDHHVAESWDEAAVLAARAGVHVDLGGLAFAQLVKAVREGRVEERLVDEAASRVLLAKFEMGLFDHPYVIPKAAEKGVRTADHLALARQVAQESITLLKNKNHILPLSGDIRVAVVGPNANSRYNLLGDYTAPQSDDQVVTVLGGIMGKLPASQVEYVRGCAIRDTTLNEIAQATAAARRADVVVAVVGGSSARDFRTSYEKTGAASEANTVSDMECGEGFDRASLSLMGRQEQLLHALRQTGKPLVVVYVEGRPLDKTWAAGEADALLTAYYPGQQGGAAIADVLFGDCNPAGRLSVSVPRGVGQLPVYYNRLRSATHEYIDMTTKPLFAFGYGLSYTKFEYSDLRVRDMGDGRFEVSFDVANVGGMDGDEVPQLYLTDEVASVVMPVMQLRHFCRIHLKAGERSRVSFLVGGEDFEVVTPDLRHVAEPGTFEVMVGAASDDIRLREKIVFKPN